MLEDARGAYAALDFFKIGYKKVGSPHNSESTLQQPNRHNKRPYQPLRFLTTKESSLAPKIESKPQDT